MSELSYVNECCADPTNRADGPGPRGGETPEGVTINHCETCQCRHFEVEVDPGVVGLTGAAL